MVQIKLSIAFVLAAAAIAPVIAHPIGDRVESLEARGEGRPSHHHRRFRYRHQGGPPADSSTE